MKKIYFFSVNYLLILISLVSGSAGWTGDGQVHLSEQPSVEVARVRVGQDRAARRMAGELVEV